MDDKADAVDAIIRYDVRIDGADGVMRTESWQERLIRRGDVVWIERVLPDAPDASHSALEVGHKHFDYGRSARLVERLPDGAVRLRFVDRERRMVVEVPAAEYGTVGFSPNWEAAAHIIAPAAVAGMKPAADAGMKTAASAGRARAWREENTAGWQHRLLWSDAMQLPIRVESRMTDGRVVRTLEVRAVSLTPPDRLPWRTLDGYERRTYDDFTD